MNQKDEKWNCNYCKKKWIECSCDDYYEEDKRVG